MAIITVGSANAAMAISLLEPIPPNELPASSPASARKNVLSKNTYMSKMMFPKNCSSAAVVNTGTMNADRSIVPIAT